MKRIYFIMVMMFGLLLCSCGEGGDKTKVSGDLVTNPKSATKSSEAQPIIQFDKTEFDFGKILQGEVVSYTFHFTNVGNAPLLILAVDKSCGCTASDFPREPIAPGQKGDIKVTYDSKGHHGFQTKSLVVNANTNPSYTNLRIKAEVRTPDQL